jgi:hypothetical protein
MLQTSKQAASIILEKAGGVETNSPAETTPA